MLGETVAGLTLRICERYPRSQIRLGSALRTIDGSLLVSEIHDELWLWAGGFGGMQAGPSSGVVPPPPPKRSRCDNSIAQVPTPALSQDTHSLSLPCTPLRRRPACHPRCPPCSTHAAGPYVGEHPHKAPASKREAQREA
jgi:hypothetical protein